MSCCETKTRQIRVELLYLELEECDRCGGTGEALKAAIADVEPALRSAGVEVSLTMTHVTSEGMALERAFTTSPTVRINGRDAQLDYRESACGDCGELAGCGVDCRVWTWRGKEYTVPPKEMLADAILRGAYADPFPEPNPLKALPENLRAFFRGRRNP